MPLRIDPVDPHEGPYPVQRVERRERRQEEREREERQEHFEEEMERGLGQRKRRPRPATQHEPLDTAPPPARQPPPPPDDGIPHIDIRV